MSTIDTLCIELTARCSLRCVHCSANAAPERRSELPVDILAERLSELKAITEIYLSGGEPFEYRDLLTVIRIAEQIASIVVAYSSGTRITETGVGPVPCILLEHARDAGLARIDFSLYAASPAAHDAITRVSGSFDATLETMRNATSAHLPFGIHFVPIGNASEDVINAANLGRVLGAERFHVLALAQQGRARSRFATLEPTAHFWRLLEDATSDDREDVVLSSAMRRKLGRTKPTSRDAYHTAFIDVRGFVYSGEGQRSPASRSRSSILGPYSIDAVVREAAQAH